MADLNWRLHAACAGEPLQVFFPATGEKTTTAKLICTRCPVKVQCLEFALDAEGDRDAKSRHGIYGGKSPNARWKVWRCRAGRCEHQTHKAVSS